MAVLKSPFKCCFLAIFTLVFDIQALAQNISINASGAKPDSSAMLDVQSSTKGLLIPRTDTNTINNSGTSIATGLLIYQTANNTFYYYNGSRWLGLSNENLVDSDNQQLIISNDSLSISNGNSVNLNNYLDNTDQQDLSLSGNTLSLTNDATAVDLSAYVNTDNQSLSISGNNLSINNGNTVNLSSFKDDLGNHVLSQTLRLGNNMLSFNSSTTQGMRISANNKEVRFLLNGASHHVGITQNTSGVGGLATMELATEDVNANLATRLLLRGGSSNADIEFYRGAATQEQLTMKILGNSGKVQINSPSSNGMLNVGYWNITPYDYPNSFKDYPNGGSNTRGSGHATAYDYSIWASHVVAGSAFHAISDKRIKSVVGLSNAQDDLNTLLQLKVTDYKMKDNVKYGEQSFKKLIAQDVKLVYPQAVSDKGTAFLPNIYVPLKIDSGWVVLPDKMLQLSVGQRIKLFLDKEAMEIAIASVKGDSVLIEKKLNGEAFVYGTEVHNFHTIDYEAIFMLNVSATQELYNQLQLLRKEVAASHQLLLEERERNTVLNASLEERLRILENIFHVSSGR